MSGAYQLQIALYEALANGSTETLVLDFANDIYATQSPEEAAAVRFLADHVRGVYDNPPQRSDPESNAPFPYLTIGEGPLNPWDTDTETGTEAVMQVHSWSRASHFLETKQIQQAVYDLLHRRELLIPDYAFVGCDLVTQTVDRDPDGITIHGVQEFRIIYEEP